MLIESGLDFAVADMPSTDKFMLHVYAVSLEWERDAISRRTREALAEAKARGVFIGATWGRNLQPALERRAAEARAFDERARRIVESCLAREVSQRRIAELIALGVRGPGGRGAPAGLRLEIEQEQTEIIREIFRRYSARAGEMPICTADWL